MGKLQDAFDRQIERLPRLGIERVVREKLGDQDIEDELLLKRIVDALMSGNAEAAEIPCDRPIRLKFTDADFKRVQEAAAALNERMPDLVEELLAATVEETVTAFRVQWEESRPSIDPTAEVRARIRRDWAEPLDSLRLLVTLCSEKGERFNVAHLKSRQAREGGRTQALARLHIRACRIADEIQLVLEHGHTEGAQARWRTLHEIAVTASLIAEGGDALARRFFDHEAVERKRVLEDHRRAAAAAGESVIPSGQAVSIEREYAVAVARHGKHFQGMYGWASGQLGMPADPKFHHLQEVAGSLSLKLRYRLSSFDTHASTQTLEQPLHHWDPTTHIPDAFAAGFEGPGIDTAQAIVQVTALLYPQPWDLDAIVSVQTLGRLRDDTAQAWLRAAREIDRRERRWIERATRAPARRMGYVKAKPGKRRI